LFFSSIFDCNVLIFFLLTDDWGDHYNEKAKFENRLQELEDKQTHPLCRDCLNYITLHIDAQTDFLNTQIQSYLRSLDILNEESPNLDLNSFDYHINQVRDQMQCALFTLKSIERNDLCSVFFRSLKKKIN
jgi:hypothetical protein